MALRAGGAAGPLLQPLLLACLAAAAVNGSSAEAAKAPGGRSEAGLNAKVSTELEFGACTVTCGIGFREVLLTRGCPVSEAKCIVRVEECRGPADCGWGIPISEGPACVKMLCISIPPENRFKYVWKMLIPSKTAHILPHDSAVMEVRRDTHSVTFQCETQENGTIIASVKYGVCAITEIQTKKKRRTEIAISEITKTDATMIIMIVTGVIVAVGVIFAVIFLILRWVAVKSTSKSKSKQDPHQYVRMIDESSQHNME